MASRIQSDISRRESHNPVRSPLGSHELDLIDRPSGANVDDRADVTLLQAYLSW
jgi:hypothetical protein